MKNKQINQKKFINVKIYKFLNFYFINLEIQNKTDVELNLAHSGKTVFVFN